MCVLQSQAALCSATKIITSIADFLLVDPHFEDTMPISSGYICRVAINYIEQGHGRNDVDIQKLDLSPLRNLENSLNRRWKAT